MTLAGIRELGGFGGFGHAVCNKIVTRSEASVTARTA